MSGIDEKTNIIDELVPCRKKYSTRLLQLFGEREQYAPSSVFIFGHNATGKSAVINNIMRIFELPHIAINCIELYSPRLIFEHILNDISGIKPSCENCFTSYARCDNANDFIRMFVKLLNQRENLETYYIVIDKAERLRDFDVNMLPTFLRLQELTSLNVCVVMMSELVWEKFHNNTGFRNPLVIHFQEYSKDELVEIMTLDCPEELQKNFYRQYVNLLLSVCHLVCRNLTELRHLASINLSKYLEPIHQGDASFDHTAKLWRNIEPHLKRVLQTVYLREIQSSQWTKSHQDVTVSHAKARLNVELPFHSKFFLISGYIASYNPAISDGRFFSKRCAKATKKAKLAKMKRGDRTSNQLLGPKPFPLDRLMAIFYAIIDGKVSPNANIFCQIQSLVTLGLFLQLSTSDLLDTPKYKCIVSLDFIKSTAKSVNFEIMKYLYDFV